MPLVTLKEAVARNVRDGQTLALEGFTHLIPFAAGHEILRQGRRDLRTGAPGRGPQVVITDYAVLKPEPRTDERPV